MRGPGGLRTAVVVRSGGTVTEYRLGDEDGRATLVPAQGMASTPCDRPFRLEGPDHAAPARLLAGSWSGCRGRLSDASLDDDGTWGLVWHVRVTRGGASQTVLATPDGSVLAVTA